MRQIYADILPDASGGGRLLRFVRAGAVARLLLAALDRRIWTGLALFAILALAGSSAPTALQTRARIIQMAADLPVFDFAAWEAQSLWQKLRASLGTPGADLSISQQTELVRAYLDRAQEIGRLEWELNELLSVADFGQADPAQEQALQDRLAALRGQQAAARPTVEAVLQRQVQAELAAAGLGVRGLVLPPVAFAFTEPPKKLTVSPRDRIATVHSRMLQADIDPLAIDASEQAIAAATDLSAYITNVGGLGVYPAMVVDRASLQWVLSTVAHEWVHNYLSFFPLGLGYGRTVDITILNETVADIVGDEIGTRLARRYYPKSLPRPVAVRPITAGPSAGGAAPPVETPPPFSFRQEMQETRQRVDALLAAGLVETAEAYMEARRRYFVANGYPLRVLNQAYFAFHGNYATGAAASSPIGPKLEQLRQQSVDLAQFLERVRWFTGADDLDEALR